MRLPFRRPAAAAWRARWLGTVIALVAAGGAVALGDAATATSGAVVVPNAYASVESWYGNGGPLNCAAAGVPSQRYQQVFAGNEVGAGTITQLAFRPDASQGAFGPTTVPNVTIALSTTTQPVGGLAQNFGSNTGADVATVFSGDLVLSSAATGPSGGPKDFDVIVPLQQSFVFDGEPGNLLLDVTIPTCVRTGFFDAVDGTSSVSEVHTYYFDSTSDRADQGWPGRGLVTQFMFAGSADDTAPDVAVAFTPGSNGWFTTSPAVGMVTASDTTTGSSDISSIECTGGTVGTVTGLDTPTASATVSVSAQGTSDVTCTATDSAGNIGTSNTATVQLDSVAPAVTVTSVTAPTDGFMAPEPFATGFPVTVGAAPISVAGTASDATSGVASVEVNTTAATGTTSWSATAVPLSTSSSTATAVVTDAAGNQASVTAATLDLDLDADGIANNIDGNSTVTPPVGQARTPSTRFSDKQLGGATSGLVKSLVAGAVIAITDSSVGGVSVAVSGSGQAKLTLDGKAGTVSVPAGGHAILTDPPGVIQLRMLTGAGTIDYTVNGEPVTVSVAEGATAVVSETYTNGRLTGVNVTAPDSPAGSVTVNGIEVGSSRLSAKLTLSATRFELAATLTAAAGTTVRLGTDDLAVTVGAFRATIPGAALKKNKQGYAFTYPVGAVTLTGLITATTESTYRVNIKGNGPNRAATANPVGVSVSIGSATGYALVTAKLG